MSEAAILPSLSDRTARAGEATLSGGRRGLRGLIPFIGPAVVASIAYMDPGNFATNIQAGARHGYMLLWVVLLANADRHAVPGAVRTAWHRHRAQPGGAVPDAFPAASRHRDVAGQRSRGDGHRSRRNRSAPPSASACCFTCRCWPGC